MGYVEDLLASNEQIEYETRKHWVAPLFSTVTGSLMTAGGLVAMFGQLFTETRWLNNLLLWGGLVALLIGLAMLTRAFVIWWSEEYFVTNQKVMKVSGILRKTAAGSALEKINDITISQGLLGRALGYGTLQVLTAADESNLTYTAMRAPMEFRKVVLDQKQVFEQADARHIAEAVRQSQARLGPAPGPASPPPPAPAQSGDTQPTPVAPGSPQAPKVRPGPGRPLGSPHMSAQEITETIARLAQLRDTGAISAEEFEAKKDDLLGRL